MATRRALSTRSRPSEILSIVSQAVKPMGGHRQRITYEQPPRRIPDAPPARLVICSIHELRSLKGIVRISSQFCSRRWPAIRHQSSPLFICPPSGPSWSFPFFCDVWLSNDPPDSQVPLIQKSTPNQTFAPRINNTGVCATRTTPSATLPNRRRLKPESRWCRSRSDLLANASPPL